MKRLSLSIVFAVVGANGSALAADPAFCASMCASEQRTCRANAQSAPPAERFGTPDMNQRNTLARTAQGEVPGPATRALDAAGDNGRRMARLGTCDSAFQQCARGCGAAAGAHAQRGPRQATAQPATGG